jgi:enamine deaminase RidA (YjgF/YER057c/UK114 family)
LGFDQAQLIEGHQRLLVCSGQDAVDAGGNHQHPGDMAAQLELALDNLEAVLAAADMTLANIVRLNMYTTNVDELGGKVIIPPFDAPWSTATYTIRVTVLGDPQGATFIASKFVPENKDLGS